MVLNLRWEDNYNQTHHILQKEGSHGDSQPTPKMSELKPISYKEINESIKGKGLRGRKDYALRDLKAKLGLKPLVERRVLLFHLEDMKPAMFDSMMKAAKAVRVKERIIRYVRDKERDFIKRVEGGTIKVSSIKWC